MTQFVGIKLNRNTDADILAALDAAESKQGLIKEALRYYLRFAGSHDKQE